MENLLLQPQFPEALGAQNHQSLVSFCNFILYFNEILDVPYPSYIYKIQFLLLEGPLLDILGTQRKESRQFLVIGYDVR